MAKRTYRLVYDSGRIYKLTEKQYREFIFRNVNKVYTEGPYYFGALVGESSFDATRATKADYEMEGARLRAEKHAQREVEVKAKQASAEDVQ